MEKKRPQLNLDELHRLKWLLGGVLVLLSVWTVSYLDFDAWTLMILATVGVTVALVRPDWPARVPAWAHRLAFPAVVAFFAGDLWITGEVLPAIVRLDLLLLFYRGVSLRKKRDDLQVIVLGLFLIVVAGVLTVSLVFAAQILVFTACALGFLLVITLVESAETGVAVAATRSPGWIGVKWGRLFARLREVTDWRVVLLGAALFAGVVTVSALLFLAIPRFQLENSLFLERFASRKARSGFNETIKFSDVTDIQQDNSLAASVDVTDRAQIPATPYWRMLVLDEYRDGAYRLSASLRRTFTLPQTGALLRGAARPRLGTPVYWTFYLEGGISRYLPLLGTFEQLRFTEMQNYRQHAELGLVGLRDEPGSMTAYRVEGMVTSDAIPDASFGLRLKNSVKPTVDPLLMLRTGVAPSDQETLARWVREISGGTELPAPEFTRRAMSWLGQHHVYSLQTVIPDGPGDPIVRWLGSKSGGHCELFAGSFVLLARAAGFPARFVAGFRGGSWNGYSNNFTLRNSDAHAWCEIFDRDAGAWRRADPTLGAASAQADETRGEAALARRTDRSWSARLDSLRMFWYRRVVNFDQRSQVETLKAVKEATENAGQRVRVEFAEAMRRLREWLLQPWGRERVMSLLAMVAALIGLGWVWRRLTRGWWREFRSGRSGKRMDPVRAEAARWLGRIAECGSRIAEGEATRGNLLRLRFGARATWPEPEAVFREAKKTLRTARRRRR